MEKLFARYTPDPTNLCDRVRNAFLNMHSQVYNGGFQQWILNGYYALDYNFLLNALEFAHVQPQKYPLLVILRGLLQEASQYSAAMDGKHASDENEEAIAIERLDALDQLYYGLNETALESEINQIIGE